MRTITLFLSGSLLFAGAAAAADQRALNSLRKLDPVERLEQRCDLEAMERIARDGAGYRPDKVIAYVFADPLVEGDEMRAGGAAFRSGGAWYRLAYECRTGPKHMRVEAFRYRIGEAVPRSEWEEHYLVE